MHVKASLRRVNVVLEYLILLIRFYVRTMLVFYELYSHSDMILHVLLET